MAPRIHFSVGCYFISVFSGFPTTFIYSVAYSSMLFHLTVLLELKNTKTNNNVYIKKMIFALTISVIAIFCSSCGTTMKVAVNPNSSYSKNNPITIIDESKYSEKTGALGELVMTSHFRGNKKIQIVLKKLVKEMNNVIK